MKIKVYEVSMLHLYGIKAKKMILLHHKISYFKGGRKIVASIRNMPEVKARASPSPSVG